MNAPNGNGYYWARLHGYGDEDDWEIILVNGDWYFQFESEMSFKISDRILEWGEKIERKTK